MVQENPLQLVDILHISGPVRVALPIKKNILDLTKMLWKRSWCLPPNTKRTEKRKYQVPSQGHEHFCLHPTAGMLVTTVIKKSCMGCFKSIPKDKDLKKLDLFERNVYSVSEWQARIANRQIIFVRCHFTIWDNMYKFIDKLPEDVK